MKAGRDDHVTRAAAYSGLKIEKKVVERGQDIAKLTAN